MDDLALVKSLVEKLATNLTVPVSCKIRLFPVLQDTINYTRLLEDSGCSLIAVHGRTREERTWERANWDAIKSIKNTVKIPVLANGNVRHMDDIQSCLATTGNGGNTGGFCNGLGSEQSSFLVWVNPQSLFFTYFFFNFINSYCVR